MSRRSSHQNSLSSRSMWSIEIRKYYGGISRHNLLVPSMDRRIASRVLRNSLSMTFTLLRVRSRRKMIEGRLKWKCEQPRTWTWNLLIRSQARCPITPVAHDCRYGGSPRTCEVCRIVSAWRFWARAWMVVHMSGIKQIGYCGWGTL